MSADDMKLVQLVARRYRQLQGLRTAIDAAALLLLWSLLQIPETSRRAGPYLAALTGWAILAIWGDTRAAQFYRERFGRVVEEGRDDSRAARVLLIWLMIVMGGAIGFALPVLIVYAGGVAWRDRPYRTHWVLFVAAAVVLGASFVALDSPVQFNDWHRRFVWTAASLAALCGFLDHRLLMRAMRAGRSPVPDASLSATDCGGGE